MSERSTIAKLRTVFLVALIVFSTFATVPVSAEVTSAGNVSVGNTAPSVSFADATINDTDSPSTIKVAYNASEDTNLSDLKLRISGPNFTAEATTSSSTGINQTLSSHSDVVEFTIPEDAYGGGTFNFYASIVNTSSNEYIVSNRSIIEVKSPVSISNVSTSPSPAYTDSQVTVEVTLKNDGSSDEPFTVDVSTTSGSEVRKVTVPSSGKTETFNFSFHETGTNYIWVNNEPTESIEIKENPIKVQAVSASENSLKTYRNVTINATLNNTASTEVSKTVELEAYNSDLDRWESVDTKSVTLSSNEIRNVSFVRYFDYDTTAKFRVSSKTTEEINVTRNPIYVIEDATTIGSDVSKGESTDVNVTLYNSGEQTTSKLVFLERPDSSRVVKNVTVEPGKTETVSFTPTFDIGGTHPLSVNNDAIGVVNVSVSDVEVTNFDINSTEVYLGQDINVSTTVTNTGDSTRKYVVTTVAEKQNDDYWRYRYKTISVDAGESKTISNDVSVYQTGTYNVRVNENNATTVTVERAIKTKSASIAPEVVTVGENVTITQTFENPTNKTQSRWVYVSAYSGDGESQYKYREVALDAGESTTETFNFSFNSTGQKYVWFNGTGHQIIVSNSTDGTPNLTLSRVYTPSKPVNNTTAGFYAEITNDGDGAAVKSINLTIGGTVVDSTRVYVPANDSTFVFLEHRFTQKGDFNGEIVFGDDQKHTFNGTVRESVIVKDSVDVTVLGGTQPTTSPTAHAEYRGGYISAWLTSDAQYGYDLAELGVDNTTRFEISFTVRNYTPRVVIGRGQGLDWTTSEGPTENTTNVTVEVNPTQMDYKTDFAGSYPNSPTEWSANVQNDTADIGFDSVVMLGIGTVQDGFAGESANAVTDMHVTTDAQLFTMPRYVNSSNATQPHLEIDLAAAHRTADGELNQGYYDAFLPNSLLDAWGVTDPKSQLQASFTGQNVSSNVTVVEDGAYLNVSLHYSTGTLTITKQSSTDDTDSESDTNDGGSSGTNNYGGSTGDSSTDDTTTETTTTTTTATTTTTTETTTVDTTTTTSKETTTTETTTTTTTATTTSETTTEERTTVTETTTVGTTNDGGDSSVPGFGVTATFGALVAAALLALRRQN